MKVIVVTGGIGGGKSSFCRILEEFGIPVYDCDSAAKALYATYPALAAMLSPDIFSVPEKLKKLETALFPVLLDDFNRWAESTQSAYVALESATLLQKPFFASIGDFVVLVTAPENLRFERAMSRGGISAESIRERMMLQPDLSGNSRVNFIIDNSSSLERLRIKAVEFLKAINYNGTKRKN